MLGDAVLTELFDQIIDGWDIPKPTSLNQLKAADASVKRDGVPYSALTNLAHAVLWQEAWLSALRGDPVRQQTLWENDFRIPEEHEYRRLRKRFAEGLHEARKYASGELVHQRESEEKARTTLLRIAIHASYHLGQCSLLRRMAKG